MDDLISFAAPLTAFAVLAGWWALRAHARKQVATDFPALDSLARVAPAGIWRGGPDGRLHHVNAAWLEMAGLEPDQWQDFGWMKVLHPEDRDRVLGKWMQAVSTRSEYRDEFRWQRPDGTTLWIMCVAAPEYSADGELRSYVGTNIDITRTKELEAELELARQRAEHEAQSKSTFLANMSHEIRTPMNGVIGFTDLLLESDLDDDQRAQVQLISDSGRAMMQLLNDILDHAKIESGQLRIVPEATDLRHKLNHCVALMEPMARAKGLSLGIWVDDAVPELVALDTLRVRQVLLNLIGNAVKFTQSGGIDIEARVENSTEGRSILITVIDTGIGIEEHKLEAIFTPFEQEDGSVARQFGGTGLGLAICSQLVEMMGGRITVHSKRGVGTQFTVRLPLIPVYLERNLPSLHEPFPGEGATSSLAGMRILVAEDHQINQQLVMAMAMSLGLDAALAEDGEEAVARVIEADELGRPFVAVLMDMQMPGVDGLEATRRLRSLGFDADRLPIIALTANCYPEDVKACMAAGMQSHLGKPVTTVALARELARWLLPDDGLPLASDDMQAPCTSLPPSLSGLEEKYHNRKSEIVAELRQVLTQNEPADWERIGSELHKLAGVAATFGEPELGEASRRLERWIKTSGEQDEMLAALRQEWPIFEHAA